MFSLPRDLFYHGRRINMVYSYWGKDQFLKEISDISGLSIKKYIHVDMFAFIDVINIIGGIDVTLDSDLIDPTYKIKENGEWTTLCYRKGTYQMNGLAALRVARSRNFSSDFDRAKRQQKVLLAVRDKFKTLGVGNLDKVYAIISTLMKYIQTNFTPLEMISYFGKFKNFTVSDQHTIDTSNVLYSTYSNIYLLKKEDIPQNEDFDKGAWIVLPKDNDWNVIKWYVREMIK
jgi:polyisoprenyl-teichoic acid--peptidoglycan teichoic acid transferase